MQHVLSAEQGAKFCWFNRASYIHDDWQNPFLLESSWIQLAKLNPLNVAVSSISSGHVEEFFLDNQKLFWYQVYFPTPAFWRLAIRVGQSMHAQVVNWFPYQLNRFSSGQSHLTQTTFSKTTLHFWNSCLGGCMQVKKNSWRAPTCRISTEYQIVLYRELDEFQPNIKERHWWLSAEYQMESLMTSGWQTNKPSNGNAPT